MSEDSCTLCRVASSLKLPRLSARKLLLPLSSPTKSSCISMREGHRGKFSLSSSAKRLTPFSLRMSRIILRCEDLPQQQNILSYKKKSPTIGKTSEDSRSRVNIPQNDWLDFSCRKSRHVLTIVSHDVVTFPQSCNSRWRPWKVQRHAGLSICLHTQRDDRQLLTLWKILPRSTLETKAGDSPAKTKPNPFGPRSIMTYKLKKQIHNATDLQIQRIWKKDTRWDDNFQVRHS